MSTLMILAVSAAVTTSTTSGFVAMETRSDHLLDQLTLKAGVEHRFSNLASISAFALVKGSWAQAYVGPTLSLMEGLRFGFSVGGQQSSEARMVVRYAAFCAVNVDAWNLLGQFEIDHRGWSGFWYDVSAGFSPGEWLNLGVHGRRFVGVGPRLIASIPETPLKIAATWAVLDPEASAWSVDRVVLAVIVKL